LDRASEGDKGGKIGRQVGMQRIKMKDAETTQWGPDKCVVKVRKERREQLSLLSTRKKKSKKYLMARLG